MRIFLYCFIYIAAINFLSANFLFAQDKPLRELPKTGRLAGSTSAGAGQIGFEGDWGGLDLNGADRPPISASVNRISEHEWSLQVFNNSEDKFRINLKIVQTNNGKSVKSDALSLTMAAGEKHERKINAHGLANNAQVDLVRWTKTERKLSQEELLSAIAEKRKELEKLEAQLAPTSTDSIPADPS